MSYLYTFWKFDLRAVLFSLALFLTLITSSVVAQTLTVQTPNGGEVWAANQVEIATWTGQNIGSVVKIEFSYDGGSNWWYLGEVPSGPNGGSASIGVPNTSTTNAILKISDVFNPVVNDQSDAPFTVYVPPIVVWEPSANSAVFANTLTQVYWILNGSGISLLNAELSTDNGQTYTPIAQNLNAFAGYTYLNLSGTPADECILKLYNAQDPSQYGLSEVFAINPLPVYTLTSPAGGEIVNTYSPYLITWNVENPYSSYCYLEYSTDNGNNWEVINNGSSIGTSGSYEWITPNIESGECRIRITDSYAYTSSDISEAFTIMSFPEIPVCMVTVDNQTNYNVILWEKPVSDLISDFLVYKETDEANVYEIIDTVSYNDVPMATDMASNPAMRPYRYKIGFRDSENIVYPSGDYHQTIHLTINQGINNNWNLIWTPYVGFTYASYTIYRKSGGGEYEQIATVSSSFNSFTDFNAPAGEVSYMVSIIHPTGCNTGSRSTDYSEVYSNEAAVGTVSVNETEEVVFSIYPVPANEQINIQLGNQLDETINIKIIDLTGRIVYSGELIKTRPDQVHSINSSSFPEGVYMVDVISDGNRIAKKITVKR